jgi:hypothetical protein
MKNELYHHGIKGQRWGVRRFQNKDGSLKAAGEKRYNGEYSLNRKYEQITGEKKHASRGRIRDHLGAAAAGIAGVASGVASVAGAKAAMKFDGSAKAKQKAMNAPVNMLRDASNASRNMYGLAEDSMTRSAIKNASKLDLSKASDAELRDYITRYRLEREFKALRAEETRDGAERTAQMLNTIGNLTATAGSVMSLVMTYQQLKNGYFSGDKDKGD